jgi:hypothetical protein
MTCSNSSTKSASIVNAPTLVSYNSSSAVVTVKCMTTWLPATTAKMLQATTAAADDSITRVLNQSNEAV